MPTAVYRPSAEPTRTRIFHLFTGDDDLYDPAGYTAVTGVLHTVGQRCQVYVDSDIRDPQSFQPTVDDIIRTFDEDVQPKAERELGHAIDVDRDGRFTILLTPWLGKLSNGKVALGGFVRGSDFYRDLAAPFGNRCDMMYLSSDLKPGPRLRTIIAHEYTHAVVFCEHVFAGDREGSDEESWLNEGLAHVVEERRGHGWSNLDYRVSAFLNAPERYPLVVPDYFGSGLWRNPGCRGATFLFLRSCVDRHGDDLVRRLVQSDACGVTNLEACTGRPFEESFRDWTADLVLERLSLGVRRPLGHRLLAGPRFHEMALSGDRRTVALRGTSAAYLLLHTPAGVRSRVQVNARPEDQLQVSLIRLPRGTGRLEVRVDAGPKPRTVRLMVTAHDAALALDDAVWEQAVPQGGSGEASCSDGETVRAWFGDPHLRAGETRTSIPIALPAKEDEIVFKVTAKDPAGRRVTGWAVFP